MSSPQFVYDSNGKAQALGSLIGKGGQGEVFALADNPLILVKLFHDRNSRLPLEKKVRLQVTERDLIQNRQLAWPQISVFDAQNQWLGYAMRKAAGKPLSRLAHPKLYEKHFPRLNRSHIVTMLLDLIQVVHDLHSRQIVLGDINLDNVLYDLSNCNLTIIDNDSFQLDRNGVLYACPVGKAEMTPPEHLGKDFKTVRRTKESDLFSLAILMFQCLMLGRHPYDNIGGGNPVENLRTGNFPYGEGGARPGSTGAIPAGPWYTVWSHLTYNVKTLFIDTFGGGATDPNKRATLDQWREALEKYKYALTRGYNDSAIRPTSPKASKPGFESGPF